MIKMGASCFWTAPRLEKTEESSLYRQPMSDGQWRKNLAVMKKRIEHLDHSLLCEVTAGIRAAYDWLEPFMERYCEITCPVCSDFCCQATRVFFNHTDLLVILTLDLDPPPGQTRSRASEPCRYLTPAGCSLKRTLRPYVCVWYLCEAQMKLYGEEPASTQRSFVTKLGSIRANRLRIASHYESHFPPWPD